MKKIVLIITFLVTSLFATMNWMDDLDDAYDKAESQNKIVMVFLSQKGCPACKYMKNIVLKNDKIVKEFNKDFIAVHLDIHKDYVPLELEHFVTPTIYFLKFDETILDVVHGPKNEKDFLEELQKVKKIKK